MRTIDMVREFHDAFNIPTPAEPGLGDQALRDLRVSLIKEEFGELKSAMLMRDPVAAFDALCDLQVVTDGAFLRFGINKELQWDNAFNPDSLPEPEHLPGAPMVTNSATNSHVRRDLQATVGLFEKSVESLDVQSIKESLELLCADINTAFHALGMMGIKMEGMAEVHRANMSKLGRDGRPIYREDGKVLKGPNYTPPQLRPIVLAAKQQS